MSPLNLVNLISYIARRVTNFLSQSVIFDPGSPVKTGKWHDGQMKYILILCLLSQTSFARTVSVKRTKSFADVSVKRVTSFPDCTIKFVSSFADVHIKEVSSFADVSVKEVTSFADVTVKEVTSFADVTVSGTRDLILAAGACPQVR